VRRIQGEGDGGEPRDTKDGKTRGKVGKYRAIKDRKNMGRWGRIKL
jgi:hypothetical protein